MPSSSPAPVEAAETVTAGRFFSWLAAIPLILIGGCVLGVVVLRLLRVIIPDLNLNSGVSLPERVLLSLAAGSFMAILISLIWMPYARLYDWRWWAGHIIVMSAGVFAATLVVSSIGEGECETFPLRWIAPTISIGLVLSLFHWLSLRRQMKRAGWWVLAMISSWMLVWFLTVGFQCVLSD
jgi:hypothetical protein